MSRHQTSPTTFERLLVVACAMALAVALAACDQFAAESGADSFDPTPDEDSPSFCIENTDCSLVASSCCGCPTFAAPGSFGDSCEDVECPLPSECAPAEAVCGDDGQCALVCSPVVATQVCESGFLVDEAGCTLDQCEADIAPECAEDSECVVAPADCCGCELGGNDTAIPAGTEDAHLGSLMCDGPISCPGVSSCEEGGRAACLGGKCRYLTDLGIDAPPPLCGTAETGSCPLGEVCVLNPASGGGIGGIGVCEPQ